MNGSTSSKVCGCEIFAALMKQSGTAEEIAARSGVCLNSVYTWLREMVRSGLVQRRHGQKAPESTGRAPIVYTLQKAPFEQADWS